MGVCGANRGKSVMRYWPLTNSFFLFLTSVPIFVKIDQEMWPWDFESANRRTHRYTDTRTSTDFIICEWNANNIIGEKMWQIYWDMVYRWRGLFPSCLIGRFCVLEPPPPFEAVRDNVQYSSWAHRKARSGLPISFNWTYLARCYGWSATSENRRFRSNAVTLT